MLFCRAFRVVQIIACLMGLLAFSNSALERKRRYLVYEDGAPSRTQFIFGIGIPIETKSQAVTVGTVIKFEYDLPKNSSEYSTRFFDFAATVSRGLNKAGIFKTGDSPEMDVDEMEASETVEESTPQSSADDERDQDIIIAEKSEALRKKRTVTKLNNDTNVDQQQINIVKAIEVQENVDMALKVEYQEEPENYFNRWNLYKVLEQIAESHGYSGRPCLLRSICEATAVPFTHHHGLLSEIAHILFTPSTSSDRLTHHSDNEYHAAERLGRSSNGRCEDLFPDCEDSLLDSFTEVGVATLSQFGIK